MSDQMLLDLGQGASLRDAGSASVLSRNRLWAERADRILSRLAAVGAPFTSEDVTAAAGLPPHPNATGSVFLRAAKRGLIVPTGEVRRATRDARHASMLRVWRGK